MHDLNSALDSLREVMPYAHGPSVRKLSKIATLLLAKNYIIMLQSSVDDMKKLVGEVYGNHDPGTTATTTATPREIPKVPATSLPAIPMPTAAPPVCVTSLPSVAMSSPYMTSGIPMSINPVLAAAPGMFAYAPGMPHMPGLHPAGVPCAPGWGGLVSCGQFMPGTSPVHVTHPSHSTDIPHKLPSIADIQSTRTQHHGISKHEKRT